MFKKRIVLMLVVLIALSFTACSNNNGKLEKEKVDNYLATYQTILDASNKATSSTNFDIELVINKISSTSYRYDVIIDNPKVGMYNISAMAVIDEITSKASTDEMMPNIGITNDDVYNMVPYQIDAANGFVEGVILSLLSSKDALRITVMVDFTNKENTKHVRQYITLYKAYQEVTSNE